MVDVTITPRMRAFSYITAVARIIIMLLAGGVIACMYLWQRVREGENPRDSFGVARVLSRWLLRLAGVKVRVHGEMVQAGLSAGTPPVMFVANHTSYLDIPVLGYLLSAFFVAKSEVASWPFFGFFAKLQNTVFVERRASRSAEQRDGIAAVLSAGHNIVFFAEGTSSDGGGVLPFKSSLFSAAESAVAKNIPLRLQPISIVCTGVCGLPMTEARRSLYAWFGEMTLLPHLFQTFRLADYNVDVVFHSPVNAADFADRKAMAEYCQAVVADGVAACLAGRNIDFPLENVIEYEAKTVSAVKI